MKLFRCDICEVISDIEPNHCHLISHNIVEKTYSYEICDECYLRLLNHFEQAISNYNHFQSDKVSEVQKLLDSLTDKEA